jgi:hydrogenase maturation factor
MVMNKKKKPEESTEPKKIGKIIKIHTLNIMVELQTEDSNDSIKDLKKMAEEIVDKYLGDSK